MNWLAFILKVLLGYLSNKQACYKGENGQFEIIKWHDPKPEVVFLTKSFYCIVQTFGLHNYYTIRYSLGFLHKERKAETMLLTFREG